MKKKVILLSLALMLLLTSVVSAAALWGQYKGYDVIRLTVGGKTIKATDAPAINFNSRTMIPIYMLKEAGINYSWDQSKRTVDIKSTSSNSFNPTQATIDIINLGGYGVTISPIDNATTATVYFEEKNGFEGDWGNIYQIFLKLSDFRSEYSRLVYVSGETTIGTVEIETVNLFNLRNGVITDEQLVKLWKLYGFEQNVGSAGSEKLSNSCSDLIAQQALDLDEFDRKNLPSGWDGSAGYKREMFIRGQEQILALYGCK